MKARSLVALAVLLGAFAAPPRARADEAWDRYEQGMAHYRAGRHEEAIRAFEVAYALQPNPPLLFNLGRCHLRLGRPDRALEFYGRYQQAEPNPPEDVRRKLEGDLIEARMMLATRRMLEQGAKPAPGVLPPQGPAPGDPPPAEQPLPAPAGPSPVFAGAPPPSPVPVQQSPPPVFVSAVVRTHPYWWLAQDKRPVHKQGWFWLALTGTAITMVTVGAIAGTAAAREAGAVDLVRVR